MNIVFFGTPEFSCEFLNALSKDKDIHISAVITQPDKPVGRKKIMTPSPVKVLSRENNIPVFTPKNLKDTDFIEQLTSLKPDLFIIVAYGKILPKSILDIPMYGNINVHPSLLPKYRGPSPVQSAIAAGERQTGVSIMLIDEKMDHGPILAQKTIKISSTDDTESLLRKSSDIGAPMLIESIKQLISGDLTPTKQEHDKATFCKLIKKEDGRIDWNESAAIIYAKSRAYTPWPGIYTNWSGKTLKLHSIMISDESITNVEPGKIVIEGGKVFIGTSTQPIEVLELQLEGKKRMPAKAFISGHSEIDSQIVS